MRITLLLIACVIAYTAVAQPANTMRVASYNLRYNTPNDGADAWPNRIEMVKSLIRYHKIELFGTQEGLRGQLNDVAQLPGWAFVGKGRDDGKEAGEHSAIFYKKDRFDLLTTGDFWLSETPDKPGKGWDATCCNRICTWARFRDKQTKKEFYFFSAHFDHQGVEARRQSGRLMVEKIKAIAKNEPVIFVGDLNSTPDTEQVKTIQASLQDAYQATKQPPYGPVGTFTGFKSDAPLNDRIDYIFVSKSIDVLSYAALTDRLDQRFPSDHLLVVADVVIK
ncbi:endonuclease/exonuclease/phosphatase family protein [Spirosoma rhododendri]|uniref:Endonuclease/exonuclease/phosphatase family protein n=1 Tax=Spirosoma rhododendri TaxID=2728024 RepID=A0A7L5DG59_9BACT|nr:endonuclease/exonuclease/phosphatase family protein [Spirosoma rhododendri]QJD77204.1 endonuclease/exonuclease/phosphatase family protein [Spirosoma rhododendri]